MKVNAIRVNDGDNAIFLKSMDIKKGDVILIELKHVEMPANMYRSYAEEVKNTFSECFPNNKCVVIPQGNMTVSLISQQDAVQIKLATPDAI